MSPNCPDCRGLLQCSDSSRKRKRKLESLLASWNIISFDTTVQRIFKVQRFSAQLVVSGKWRLLTPYLRRVLGE
ncbi:hypothetical protein PanWU01x14_356700 [Parasponia andersonii]|uniref:Uncharacterized protein n=1 Tax=Parasponia andersonii TaxID=3476 RepID=A0A2P5A8Z1_PARAD|nr:hypothetical protein PanWU01x14_356700 [Parasponia andersonii]